MRNWMVPLLIAAGVMLASAAAPAPAQAPRAGEPDNLHVLPRPQQVRIITQEYAGRSGGQPIPEELLEFYLERVQASAWTLSRVGEDISRSLARSGRASASADTVRCESGGGQVVCRTPWQSGARVVRQLSDTPCVEGQNWTGSPGRVTVLGGCAAEFAAGADIGHGREVVCESGDGVRVACPTGGGVARLSRQLSAARCVEGHSWGSAVDSVWVDHGCRAVFHVTGLSGAAVP